MTCGSRIVHSWCKQIRSLGLSFHNNHSLLQKVDALPQQPAWKCEVIEVRGDLVNKDGDAITEELEIWHRDLVDCVRALIGNTTLNDHITYAPVQLYEDETCEVRVYEGMETGDWWWDTQV
jgi:hypothetical protein